MLTAADLLSNNWRDTAPSFRLVGGGFFWTAAVRVGRLVKISRVSETMAGPKTFDRYVQPGQAVTLTRTAVLHHG